MERPEFLDMTESISIESVDQDSIAVEKEWYFDPISRVEVNDSTEETLILLQHLRDTSPKESITKLSSPKPHIGPRPKSVRTKPSIAQDSHRERTVRLMRQRLAARTIQRWYRSQQRMGQSELRSSTACECGCHIM